ncbi:MAG: SDR family NAD(P)-dependent oxidoreductase, partial [Cyanobacteria bacterium P01_G01_bin.38]
MSTLNRRKILASGTVAAAGLAAVVSTGQVNANVLNPVAPATKAVNPAGRFTGKVVLITGATSGIGETTAKAFAREGAKVAFNGRRANLGQQIESDIRAAGGDAIYIQSDVRDPQQVEQFVNVTVEQYGRLDIAFNNAGIFMTPVE